MKKFILFSFLFLLSCAQTFVDKSSVGEKFPNVSAKKLTGETIIVPDVFFGERHLIIVGYRQNAQFDIDRWLIGINQLGLKVAITEMPTISGMIPGLISSQIDEGMKKGIPSSDWASVATVYEDADKIVNFLGNEKPNSAYLVLLDKSGNVVWKYKDGFSVTSLNELAKVLDQESK
jgi:hypothetical protein